jgi:hypothetical protein
MQGCLQNWSRGISNCAARCLPRGVATVALGILGVLGAMLSLTDIFGMTAYSVSKRQREFGIHMALRAHRIQVLQDALGRAGRLLCLGSAAGLLLGMLAGKVLSFYCVSGKRSRSAGIGIGSSGHVACNPHSHLDHAWRPLSIQLLTVLKSNKRKGRISELSARIRYTDLMEMMAQMREIVPRQESKSYWLAPSDA